ncbi:hypothetical protein CROQUDRAFT_91830 [Cronartium quercuum f. sp. fusiforme G11]|uniref:Uncharacterized protein n=1 Tax=Cronartium quercuum f. sp. fusiforme G11 TaxID=708437 RepID=A0A9P6NMT5_9BASI|nr:hypothetical protein CROQUDRAFT_91830 [Cronartium quercuum f. sp. fusiforme G11]
MTLSTATPLLQTMRLEMVTDLLPVNRNRYLSIIGLLSYLVFLRKTEKVGLDMNPMAAKYHAPLETFVDANWGGEFA